MIMLRKLQNNRFFRSFAIVTVTIFGIFLLNINYLPATLAADNYSAPTDTYQETRNLNRVNTKTEELAKSKLNRSEQTKGESIYDRLVDKVDRQNKEASKDSRKTKATRR
jgi:hypothetical protein